MNQDAPYRLVLGFYYMFLGAWIGALTMLAVTAAITFKTARELHPVFQGGPFDQPFLASKFSDVMAGQIVGNVIEGLAVVQGICLGAVLLALVLQCTVFGSRIVGGVKGKNNIIRIMLISVPVGVYAVERSVLTPTIWTQRAIMYDPAQSPQNRDAARLLFQDAHRLSERLVGGSMLLLAAGAIMSPFVLAPENKAS